MSNRVNTQDVTLIELEKLRQDNEALQQRCAFLEQVIDLIPHFIFAKDQGGRFILANSAFARAFANTTPEALLGKTDADFSPNSKLVEQYRGDDQVVLASGQDLLISNERVVKADGEVFWRETIKRPLTGAGGAPDRVLGITTDVTDRRQIEESLFAMARQNSQLVTAINSLTNGVTITDPNLPDNPLIFVNPAFTEMTGYDQEEILGHNCRFLQGPDTDPEAIAEIRQAIAQRRSCKVTLLNYRKDGKPFWNELTLSPVFDEVGKLINFVGLQTDVTERKKTEQALRESEDHLRHIFTSISDHIYVTEFTGDGERINHYLSPVEALTGYPIEKLLADWSFWPMTIIHPDDRKRAAVQAERLAQGLNSEVEYRLIRADGQVIWVRDSGRVEKDPVGDSFMIYGVVSDITERKLAEQALAQTRDRALEASHLKSQLLAKVSHELRTPLGAILGYTELLQEGIFGPLSEKQARIAAEIIDSTQYLTDMVNELLSQAQLESGRVKLAIGPFSLKDMVQKVESKMAPLAQAKGLTLSVIIAPDMPETLIGDEGRLQQILINLTGNAIKFTKTGLIQVRLYRPDLVHSTDSWAEGSGEAYWAIQVSDTGPGIPKEAQRYIFEPFRQVDGSITREHTGAGLGLATVKQLITLMQGEIILESEIGQGSTFTILLPHPAEDTL